MVHYNHAKKHQEKMALGCVVWLYDNIIVPFKEYSFPYMDSGMISILHMNL